MKVLKDLRVEIPGTNTHYFNFDELSDNKDCDTLFIYGYENLLNNSNDKEIKKYKKKIYFNVTMPTEFCSPQPTDADDKFDAIYTICPYSVEWLNKIKNTNKYKLAFYPFNSKDIPEPQEKIYDVCYHGGIHGPDYHTMLDIIELFNYRYMSITTGINSLTQYNLYRATNINLTHQDKLKVVAQSKISICYNTFDIYKHNVEYIKSRKDWDQNYAFAFIDGIKKAPQFKSRFNEAAACRTLNLIKKDPWNVVERYYTPDEDFIYFNSNEELESKIKDILNNWGDYQQIIENAYQKSLSYTTEKLFNFIQSENNGIN